MGGGEEDCRTIPAIDLKKFPEAEEYRKLREASETWGCFRLVNHMIPPALMSEMISVVRSLLDLPMEIKKQNKHGINGSGYWAPSIVNPIYESLWFDDLGSRQALDSFCSRLNASSYQRVRSIVNDPSKNVRLKKLVAYWKEQAGKKGNDEDLEEIQDERPVKDRGDGRHSTLLFAETSLAKLVVGKKGCNWFTRM